MIASRAFDPATWDVGQDSHDRPNERVPKLRDMPRAESSRWYKGEDICQIALCDRAEANATFLLDHEIVSLRCEDLFGETFR